MYGSSVYNIRDEYRRAKIAYFRIFFFVLSTFILLFIAKQLIGIPFDYLSQMMSVLLHTPGDLSLNFSFKDAVLRNQFVQSIVVFVVGLISIFSNFVAEIKQIVSEQWKK